MRNISLDKVDVAKLGAKLLGFQNKWIAISEENTIVSSGDTYGEAVGKVKEVEAVVLLKVPPLDVSLAPLLGLS